MSSSEESRRPWLVGLAGFTAFLDLYATQGLLPLLARTFGVSALEVSATVSATTTAVALAAPVIGPLADVLGRKRVIAGAAFALSVPTLLAATAGSLQALVVWRFLQGLFMPAIFAVTIAYVGEECQKARVGRTMASYVTGNIIGGVTGRFLCAFLADRHGWQTSFVALGALNLVAAAALAAWLPPSRNFQPEKSIKSSIEALGRHLRTPRLWAGYVVGFNILFSIVGAFTYVNFHLAAPPFRLSTAALGSIFFVYLGGVLAAPLAGRALDKTSPRVVLGVGMAAAAAGVLTTLSSNLWFVLAGLALCASAIFVCQSAANSYIAGAAGRGRSAAAGLYVCIYYLGGTIGATVPGFAYRSGGWPACASVIVGVQLLTLCLALLLWKSPRQSELREEAVAGGEAAGVGSAPACPR